MEAAVPKLRDGRVVGDLGASPPLMPQAPWILFFSDLHLLTLYVDGERQEEAARLRDEHHGTFTVSRPA